MSSAKTNITTVLHLGTTTRRLSTYAYMCQSLGLMIECPLFPVATCQELLSFPWQICTLEEGQEYRHKLSDIQTSKMIKVAATPAAERRKKIEAAVKDMNLNSDKTAQAFGVSIDSCMTQVKGRVLPAPTLIYGTAENECVPRDGSWNMIGLKFIDAKCLKNWGIISIAYDVDERSIDNFARNLFSAGSKLGQSIFSLLGDQIRMQILPITCSNQTFSLMDI